MTAARFLPFLLLGLAGACTPSLPPEPWQHPDGAPPSASEVSYCHAEATRLALNRYPDRERDERGLPQISDQRRFPAELRFYEDCMTRAGLVRVSVPAKPS